ncbi:hypothetical protein Nepgr_013586 [Nepenthes gracilis]|uniref:Uncharacterized protein n=1 Tax=Nepenthes gracilis TaxID=150966 RepID=A0AAD3XPJ6_NEPGR|nr:hypothetical protein Nepgr_013586 [Nepenthes gracilis]
MSTTQLGNSRESLDEARPLTPPLLHHSPPNPPPVTHHQDSPLPELQKGPRQAPQAHLRLQKEEQRNHCLLRRPTPGHG